MRFNGIRTSFVGSSVRWGCFADEEAHPGVSLLARERGKNEERKRERGKLPRPIEIPSRVRKSERDVRTYVRTHARKMEAEFHIRSPLSKPGCLHIQAMFAMADTYIESDLRVRNVAFCRAFSTRTHTPPPYSAGKQRRGRKAGVREPAVVGSERVSAF